MQYQLTHLENLVRQATAAWEGDRWVFSTAASAGLLREALQETAQFRTHLVQQVFRFTRKKEIELFIQNYQRALTQLLDELYQLEQKLDPDLTTPTDLWRALCQPVQDLLSFIEDRFAVYFDLQEKAPDAYWRLVRQEIRARLLGLPGLSLPSAADHVLRETLRQELLRFSDPTATVPVTYKDILYRKDLLGELQGLSAWETTPSLYTGLEQLLLYLNYNDKVFINYLVNRMNAAVRKETDVDTTIDLLLQYSKALQQLPVKPDCALHVKHPSARAQLTQWVTEELSYQERRIPAWVVPPPSPAGKPAPAAPVCCHASVDQIGIFLRAAADIHLLSAPSQRQLFAQIAPHLATPHRPHLSGDSMRSKSYSPEKKDLDTVKDLLMQLYKQLTQY